MSDKTIQADALMVATFVLKPNHQTATNPQWWDAEQAALRILEHFGQPIPPKAAGLK